MAKTKKPIIGIMYDFDKTLSKSDMQDYGFIPSLGLTPSEFWGETGRFQKATGVERILSYMYVMIDLYKKQGKSLTRKVLNEMGKNIEYFDGVETWFKRINEFGKECGVKVEHYILSSGTKEILEGCKIAKEFKEIFGCEFYYDPETKEPVWPKLSVNYTQKTQYVYRISNGTTDLSDDTTINKKGGKHRIPYTNLIYIGDGMTDVPCMQLVQNNRGHSIALYSGRDKAAMRQLLKDRRVNICCKADYRENSELDKSVKSIIQSVSNESYLISKNEQFRKKELKLKDEEE